jgi:hypothetical protein
MKNIVIVGAVVIVVLGGLYLYMQPATDAQPNTNDEVMLEDTQEDARQANDAQEETPAPAGKLKADTFTGTLESVDTGCFADGECYAMVDGKHVTILTGMRINPQEVGQVLGTADGIGGLEAFIGQEVEVYAQDNSDGTYTLYGSEGFYIKVI